MELSAERVTLIGMVHLLPLPGSPNFPKLVREANAKPASYPIAPTRRAILQMLDWARRDAETLLEGGCDALLVENMHDLPYLRAAVGPEVVAAMALGCEAVAAFDAPFGVQVLAGANQEALGVALATGASFIRAEAFAYGHVADEGWIDASAGPLLRRKADLGADIAVWADIKKKHASHAATADLSLADVAYGSKFAGADAVIVTGASTGMEASVEDLIEAKKGKLPVLIGSGIDASNIMRYAEHAHGLIVGSSLKEDGDWRKPVCIKRVRELVHALGR